VKGGRNSERAVSGARSLPGDDLVLAMTLGVGDHQGSRAGQDCAFPAAGWRQLGGRRASAEGPPGGVGHLSVVLMPGVLPYAQTSNESISPPG